MFRSGGPIKEGIMDGMQDRPGYVIGGLIPLGAAAMRILPAAVRGFRTARTLTPGKLGTFGRIKDIFLPKKGLKLEEGGTKFPGLSEFASKPAAGEGLGFRIGSFARQNPFLALSTPSLATTAVTGAGPVALEAAKTGGKALANFLVPGERFDPFKEGGDKKTTETDTTGLKKVDSFDETEPKSKAVSQETKDQLTADRIEENRKRYYKLMGIDKMKKGAAYDSLIDASRIIQEQGGDLKGAIKSGTLQSAIINAISKNLDKSTDLKKQIDAAVLKGEIEKDIKSADTMDKRLKEAQIKRLERDEKQNTTAAKIAAVQVDKGAVTGADTAAILRADGIDYTGILPDDEFLKFKKKNKGKDERDFLIENYGALDDGKYIVGGRLVEKRGNNVAFAV